MKNLRAICDFSGWKRKVSRCLDLLYPPSCALCDRELEDGAALCADCGAGLPRLETPFCQKCGEMFPGEIDDSFKCPNCGRLRFAFEFARPAMVRDEATLELIHLLKYRRQIHLAATLGALACEAFADPRLTEALDGGWPLVPVPLHRRRLRHRHFNQAGEIARVIGMRMGLPVIDALRRTRETTTQTRLNRKQRMDNLRGAFEVSPGGARWLANKPSGAVIVDDVLTTGSTVNACARALRKAGLRQAVVVTVMRG